jgi:hypothetical protein
MAAEHFLLPTYFHVNTNASTNPGLNSTTFMLYAIGEVDWADSDATKSIQAIRWILNNNTPGTGNTVRFALASVDTLSGAPARPGADEQWVEQSPTAWTSYTQNQTPNLNATRTVAKGELMAFVMRLQVIGTGANIQPNNLGPATLGSLFPFTGNYNGSTYAGGGGTPALAFLCTDGSRAYFRNAYFPAYDQSGTNTYNATTAVDGGPASGNERGVLWVPDRPARITGLTVPLSLVAQDSAVSLRIYVNGSLAWSRSVFPYMVYAVNTTQHLNVAVHPSVTVAAGDQVRMTVLATGTGNVTVRTRIFINALDFAYATRGANVKQTRRFNTAETGTWGEPSGAELRWFSIFPVGEVLTDAPDISGADTISGVVSRNGIPVSGATVRVIRQSDNGILATTTTAQGEYTFSVASGYLYHVLAEWTDSGQRYNAKSLWDLTPTAS